MSSLQDVDGRDHGLYQNTSQVPPRAQHYSQLPPNLVDVEKHETGGVAQPKKSVYAGLGWLDRLLVLWILLAIIGGILLGNFVDNIGPALQKGKFVDVSVPIAVGLLVMMYPILCKVKYETLHHLFAHRQIWIQLGFSIVANWIIAPLLMVRFLRCTGTYVFRAFAY